MEDHAAALARLQRQFLAADHLMLVLATVAGARSGNILVWEALEAKDRMLVSHAVSSAVRLASEWVNVNCGQPTTRLGRYVVADAVAAQNLRDELPDVAVALGVPWQIALEVRDRLRRLGRDVEAVAGRLAPSWQLSLHDLADVAVMVACELPRREA